MVKDMYIDMDIHIDINIHIHIHSVGREEQRQNNQTRKNNRQSLPVHKRAIFKRISIVARLYVS